MSLLPAAISVSKEKGINLIRPILFLLLLISSTAAYTHPHNWVDLKTSFVLDDQARLVKVVQKWEFDAYYSMMTHADLLNEFSDEKAGFVETARRMVNSLKDYNYFSNLRVNDSEIDLGIPSEYRLGSNIKDGQTVLVLEMTFDITSEIKVENRVLSFQVYDPTYYIAMNHMLVENIEIIGGNATECAKRLEIPEPSDELLSYAQSLDKTQKGTDGLGASFAETVVVNCI